MNILLFLVVSAFQSLYQAQVFSFGCTSTDEVAALQKIRTDTEAFQSLLYSQMAYGQCIGIEAGAVVEGTVESSDRTVLRINAENDPPGYLVPASDFKPVKAKKP